MPKKSINPVAVLTCSPMTTISSPSTEELDFIHNSKSFFSLRPFPAREDSISNNFPSIICQDFISEAI
jgi:hypothetical protein